LFNATNHQAGMLKLMASTPKHSSLLRQPRRRRSFNAMVTSLMARSVSAKRRLKLLQTP